MDKLPHVFVSPINHHLDNEQETYSSRNSFSNISMDVDREINKILNNNKKNLKTKVKIYMDNYEKEIYLVSRTNNFILTIDNEKININDIKKIELL